MRQVAIVNLPLHSGNAPAWLFWRMVRLSGVISEIIINNFGQEEYIRRIADPYFFQSLSCVIGFDWHSSGTTTTTCGALKLALNDMDLGIKVCGGKGKTSRKTPEEIGEYSEEFNINEAKRNRLIYSSKMAAKVDSAVLQDSYQLYHHCFLFNENGSWCVIQQGMNPENRYARRYHWLSSDVRSFVEEPHSAICCDSKGSVLDMTAAESRDARDISIDLVNDNYFSRGSFQKTIAEFTEKDVKKEEITFLRSHYIKNMGRRNIETLKKAYEIQPKNYEELVAIKGIGAKAIRSLALVSDLIYGTKASWKDPVKFSFALGGKDKIPYEIDRKHYDENIEILRSAVDEARIGDKDKLNAIRRLQNFI